VTKSSYQEADEEQHKSLMNTVAFDRTDFGKETVEPAHNRTDRWMFEEEAFLRWHDSVFRDTNHGFLGIKGEPGSGKSTLMKCILNYTVDHVPECKIISFFSNAKWRKPRAIDRRLLPIPPPSNASSLPKTARPDSDTTCFPKPPASLLHVLLNLDVEESESTVTCDLVRDLFEYCSKCPTTVQNGRATMSCS
jgi:hypothetical protein